MTSFFPAQTTADYEAAKSLFMAYASSLTISLNFQHFKEELNELEKMYARPHGGIILAKDENEMIGCVAVRRITGDAGELKRMYVKPGHQHKGIGKKLLQKALLLAKECNYSVIKLDTLDNMFTAIHLYKQAGFYETAAYYYNPVETAIYMEKLL